METDKATVSFEAQDGGVLAKILIQAPSGEVKVSSSSSSSSSSSDDDMNPHAS